jgi:hypothetical protein
MFSGEKRASLFSLIVNYGRKKFLTFLTDDCKMHSSESGKVGCSSNKKNIEAEWPAQHSA